LFATHRVECCDGGVSIDGRIHAMPLQLQADGRLHP